MQFAFRWFGNAGFEFRLGKTILLVDPFLTRPRQAQVIFGRPAVDRQAVQKHINDSGHILVSHSHFDHFMDVPEIALNTNATVHGSFNTCQLARRLGVPANQIHQITTNEKFNIEGINVKTIPALHPWIPGYSSGQLKMELNMPLRLRDFRTDTCLSYLITWRGRRILVWSSIGIENAEAADMLICRAVSGGRWYARMMNHVQPKLVIPCHWDDMFRPLSLPTRPYFAPPCLALPPIKRIDLGEFERKIKNAKTDCDVLIPERFREYQV